MRDISCVGGGDVAEDIRGGIKQMISNLKWSKTLKFAVLICDAPTHGERYNGGASDHHPNEDIEDSILMLIENNILFVGILFNAITFQMFEEVKKIYREYDREELFLLANLEGASEGLNSLTIM
jgi:myosin protein heavy chain